MRPGRGREASRVGVPTPERGNEMGVERGNEIGVERGKDVGMEDGDENWGSGGVGYGIETSLLAEIVEGRLAQG
jgi:hypothetical protein